MGNFRHAYFISRTVLVQNGDVQNACRILNRIMSKEGFFTQFRRTRFYEKATHRRRRINYERMRAITEEDMTRKIEFVLRKNRLDPYPGNY